MSIPADRPVVAFAGSRRIARGPVAEALTAIHASAAAGEGPLVFDLADGRAVDLDLRGDPEAARARRAKERAYRFMTAMAGDLPGYEEATRMLFAGDWTAFDAAVESWPEGVREVAREMAEGAWRNGQS